MLKVLLVQNLEQRHHTHRSQRHHQGPSNSRPDFEWQCCRYYWFPILSRDIIKGPVDHLVPEVDVAVKLVNDQNFDVAVKLVNVQNFNLL